MTPLKLPFPAKVLWPNGRGHWGEKGRAFKAHKGWAYIATKAAIGNTFPTFSKVEWNVTVHPKTRHPIDDDNARASLKAYQDGIALALCVDDEIFAAPVLTFGEPVKGGLVVVTIL